MCVSKIHLFSLVPECSGVFCSVEEACSYSAGVGSISKTFGHEPQSFCLLTYLLLSCTSEKTAKTHLNQCLGVKGRETGRGGGGETYGETYSHTLTPTVRRVTLTPDGRDRMRQKTVGVTMPGRQLARWAWHLRQEIGVGGHHGAGRGGPCAFTLF